MSSDTGAYSFGAARPSSFAALLWWAQCRTNCVGFLKLTIETLGASTAGWTRRPSNASLSADAGPPCGRAATGSGLGIAQRSRK